MVEVRTSSRQWRALSKLLTELEGCFEACARLDAYRRRSAPRDRAVLHVEARLDALAVRVDRELDRSTARLLDAQHAAYAARTAQAVA